MLLWHIHVDALLFLVPDSVEILEPPFSAHRGNTEIVDLRLHSAPRAITLPVSNLRNDVPRDVRSAQLERKDMAFLGIDDTRIAVGVFPTSVHLIPTLMLSGSGALGRPEVGRARRSPRSRPAAGTACH